MDGHVSVLLREAVEHLQIAPTDIVVDGTVGGAGHFRMLLKSLSTEGTLIGIDADREAIERGEKVVKVALSVPTVHLVHDNFRNLSSILADRSITAADRYLFDLGWSGYQLANGKGFSFQADELLDMRYGNTGPTAADVVNGTEETELANLIYEFGEEQFSRRIASAIVDLRKREKILTTVQLVAAIKAGTPVWYHKRRLHPATKTFQALRIYVNDELGALQEGLDAALDHLTPNGRIAVITFHSIEDRIVKNMFRDAAQEGRGVLVTKKPLTASLGELSENPRARSAKLRVFQYGIEDY